MADQPAIRRICVFDPGLGMWTGHWANYAHKIRAEALRRGLQHVAFGHQRVDPAIVGDLPVRPTFTELPWTGLTGDREVDYVQRTAAIMRDFATIDEPFDEHDVLFFPTLTPEETGGFIRFAAETFRRTGARPILFGERIDAIGRDPAIAFFRRGIDELDDPSLFDEFCLLASSEETSAHWTAVFGRRVDPLCMPIALNDALAPPATRARDPGNPLRIGYFGHSSAAKGGHLLDAIVRRTLARHANVEFILHVNKNPETQESLKVFDVDRPRMRILRGHISVDTYFRCLAESDIVLMPYDRSKYAALPSSVFCEAVIANKVVVGPENTWIGREIWRLNAGATTFGPFTEEAIAEALSRAIEDYAALDARAQTAAADYLRTNNITYYLDGIIASAMRVPSDPARRFGWSAPAVT
jgi:hypothetical protein